MIKKVLITGATGFVGSHLIPSIVDTCEVSVISRRSSKLGVLGQYQNDLTIYDVEDVSLETILESQKFDAVIHLATQYGRSSEENQEVEFVNLKFPLALAKAALSKGDAIFLNADTFFHRYSAESDYLRKYRATKLDLREELRKLSDGIGVVNLQLEHVYGSGDREDKFVPMLLKKLVHNEPEIPLTQGEQSRDFVHVDDVVTAIISVLKKSVGMQKGFRSFEVGTGVATSIREFAELSKKLSRSKSTLVFGAIPYRPHELMHSIANIKPMLDLGWKPSINLVDGLREAIASISFD